MTYVKIAEFKSHLSHYLNLIRNGDQVVVTDRKTPIAKVIPFDQFKDKLTFLPARESTKSLKKIKVPTARRGTNSLKALLEDRGDDLEKI